MKYQVEINEIIDNDGPTCVGVFASLFAWFVVGLCVLIMIGKVL